MSAALAQGVMQGLGLVGTVLYLAAYALLQAGVIRGHSLGYTLMNLAAASLVLVSLFGAFNLSSALIQISWIAISIIGLARLWLLSRAARFTPEEARLKEEAFPFLAKPAARRLFDAGQWQDLPPGSRLATLGETVGGLYWIAEGTAEVRLHGEIIARCGPGRFVGEMTVFSGEPASADVVAGAGLRVFFIERTTLMRLADRDDLLRQNVEFALGRDTRAKLVETSAALRASLG